MFEKDIRKVDLPDSYRVICIADIHGNFTAFKRLLAKVNYNREKDYLFILGDLLERGREKEIPTIDYLYEISKNDKVHIISGNNDRRMRFIQNEECENCLEWIKTRQENIFTQWVRTLGINEMDITEENFLSVIKAIKEKYQDKIDFIINLPLVIETDEFICVHSGLDSREDWWETSEWGAWIGDINVPNKTGKWIISGHIPVLFFPKSKTTILPIIRHHNKTISIDGGAGGFFGGQLNAFIIEKAKTNNRDMVFSYDWADSYRQCNIIKNIKSDYINEVMTFGEKDIEVLSKSEYFTECKVVETGLKGLIKNEYIKDKGDTFKYWDYMADFVSVYENEIVSVIDNSCDGYTYIRNSQGELGWISKAAINISESE